MTFSWEWGCRIVNIIFDEAQNNLPVGKKLV
jgi:hypothetical protein